MRYTRNLLILNMLILMQIGCEDTSAPAPLGLSYSTTRFQYKATDTINTVLWNGESDTVILLWCVDRFYTVQYYDTSWHTIYLPQGDCLVDHESLSQNTSRAYTFNIASYGSVSPGIYRLGISYLTEDEWRSYGQFQEWRMIYTNPYKIF